MEKSIAVRIRSPDGVVAVMLFLIVLCINFSWCHGGDTKISCLEREREALLEFKLSLADPSNRLTSWVGEDCCNWVGVGCNRKTGRVVKLDIRGDYDGSSVGNEVSSSLIELKHLKYLDLSSNDFNGSHIPTFLGTFKALRYLNISNASFAGPIPASLVTQTLTIMDLSRNQLSGLIPISLVTSSTLTTINLSWNQLSGPIPSFVGTLPALTYFNLNHNNLSGTIPESLGNLSNLVVLSLGNNSLTGIVSEIHFDKLSCLKDLDMSLNKLVFNLSSNWIPPFQIQTISLGSCQLGPTFPLWLQTQREVENIYLSNASISGYIPNWFWSRNASLGLFQYSRLDLSHNQIRSSFPRLNSTKMYLLDLSHTIISGSLPENINDMVPNLSALLLCGNNITGSIPSSLCKMPQLEVLDIANNQMTGNLPLDCWNVSKNIQVINLAFNDLSGLIPTSIGHLPFLRSLNLNDNLFSGELPMTLQNAGYLNFLDLGGNRFSGNLPLWIGKLSSLQILNLRSNKFCGTLTSELCHLNDLHILDLAQNNFSGTIPACFKNFSGMQIGGEMDIFRMHGYGGKLRQIIKGREDEYNKTLKFLVNLDLSSNVLVGEIPKELTLLLKLSGLNLSNNQLTGGIPEMIGNLKSLQSLDLSKNQLSGSIPQSISDLGLVGYLNVSFNRLSGEIPYDHPYDPSSYIGNVDLCGIPLLKECSKENPSQVGDDSQKEVSSPGDDGFYIGMGVGTMVGFWGFYGVLFFERSWRYCYFGLLENMQDRLAFAASWIWKKLV